MRNESIIMSLGYNCEVSFRIEDYFGMLDSYLYSWSFEENRDNFLLSLQSIDDVFMNDVQLQPDHMFRDERYKIKFHPRYDILPKTGEVSKEVYDMGLQELTNRISHLKLKTVNVLKGKKPIVFLIKIADLGEEDNIAYILRLFEILKENVIASFTLIAVLEKKAATKELMKIQNEQLQIRILKKFAPINHTDIMGDIKGWYRILKEFTYADSKQYYRNLRKRRIKTFPQIIKNKFQQVI